MFTGQKLSHAYLIVGEVREALLELKKELADFGFREGSPDNYIFEGNSFLIKSARALRSAEKNLGLSAGKRFFIVAAYRLEPEAQNALLKTIEEPNEDHHFFIITDNEQNILPTVRSRLAILRFKNSEKRIDNFAKEFLGKNFPERMIEVERLLKEKEDEEDAGDLKNYVQDFLGDLELILSKSDKKSKETAFVLGEIVKMKGYLRDVSPSLRLILEYVSMVCPTMRV